MAVTAVMFSHNSRASCAVVSASATGLLPPLPSNLPLMHHILKREQHTTHCSEGEQQLVYVYY